MDRKRFNHCVQLDHFTAIMLKVLCTIDCRNEGDASTTVFVIAGA